MASFHFKPLGGDVGAEVFGINLAESSASESSTDISAALARHGVLLFRDQTITPDQHIAFSRHFGPLEEHVVSQFLLPGHPEILVISNVKENGRHIGAYGGAKLFHSDMSYKEEPSLGSLFYCRECPPKGGETEFVDMFAAYEALPDDRRRWLERQTAVHDYVYHYETYLTHRDPLTPEQKAKLVPAHHPAVITHPENGRRAIYLSEGLTSHFEGMDMEKSRLAIKEITDFATQERFTYRHTWRPGDLVFWDNRSTMHRALPFDHDKYRRVMHRTTIKGSAPFFADAR